ncbi:surface protein (macronuclear) [Tetrahymena thermophila SB210]|uniref:Surface protein n=1 Tax=Tetrahymena thermophila (strain SB210) TaxID=312017 RepID=I7MLN8_TETTS|nr:surface protein [Tetrahymena thermophila SB210]EAS02777.2 surface protein [Tetrahymena thermophila SB210]|eukprot:XP_001023022.2 surface protein [Tetrahymena thermophila SB210]
MGTQTPSKAISNINQQQWLFFMCSFDVQNNYLRMYVYQQQVSQSTAVTPLQFSSQITFNNWIINYPIPNQSQSQWNGSIRYFTLLYNINFSEFSTSFLSLVFGDYQMKYFMPLNSRQGNTIYEVNEGFSYQLQYNQLSIPSFEIDGMGMTYSATNQTAVIDNLQLSNSIFISFWIKPTIIASNLGLDSNYEYKVVTLKDTNEQLYSSISIQSNNLVFKFIDSQPQTYVIGPIADSQWHFLYLSIFVSNAEFLLINSYFSSSFNSTSTNKFYNLQLFGISYTTLLYRVNLGGIITSSQGVFSASNSFVGTIKDFQISQGGSSYDSTARNSLPTWNCDIMIGFNSNNIRCLLCKNQNYLVDKINNPPNNCQKNQCPQGYYKQPKNRQCESCDPKCKTCTGGIFNQCNQCISGNYKLKTNCYQTCPQGYYNSLTSFDCYQCDSSCLTCNGKLPTNCLSCQQNQFLNLGQCLNCHKYCAQCFGPKSSQCTQCNSSYFLLQSTCLAACPDGYFENSQNQQCTKCDSSCLTCDGSSTNCNSCPQSSFLLQQGAQQQCQPCHPYCFQCFASGNNSCISCNSGYFQDGNSCVEVCPTTKYRDSTNNYLSCQFCVSPCKECYTKEKCTSCIPGYYYVASSHQCLSCSSAIQYCGACDSPTNCTQCSQYYLDTGSKTCVIQCSQGFYADPVMQQCNSCDPSCTQCTGPRVSDCQACSPGYYLDTAQSTCRQCPDNCLKCGVDPNIQNIQVIQCLKCSSGNYLNSIDRVTYKQVICLPQCGYGYFLNQQSIDLNLQLSPSDTDGNMLLQNFINYSFVSGKSFTYCQKCSDVLTNCQSCDTNVSSCQGSFSKPIRCLSCNLTFYLKNCSCQPCSQNQCEQCISLNDGSTQCTSCPSSSYLLNGKCVSQSECESGKIRFADNNFNVCSTCNPICQTCNGGQVNNCLTCYIGYYYDKLVQTCQVCPFSCSQCTDSTHCQKCKTNYYLDQTNPNVSQCVLICPNGYFGDSNGNCTKCSTQNCQQCNNQNRCLVCNSSYYLSNNSCTQCDQSCFQCQGAANGSIKNCTQCYPGKKLYQTNCIDQCPAQTYLNSSGQCLSCDPSCLVCTDKLNTNCQQCADGFYYNDPSTCLPCDSSCKTCTGPGNSNCILCSKGYYKLGEATCIQQCIDGYFPDSINYICMQCQDSCGKCTSLSSCQQCNIGYYQVTSSNNGVTCAKCYSACSSCLSDSISSCLSCSPGYFLYNQSCLNICPKGYRGIDGLCVKCTDSNCAICDSQQLSNCSVCLKNYSYDPLIKACVQNCSNGYYPAAVLDSTKIPSDASQSVCQKCNIACSLCSGPLPTQCSGCASGYYFHPEINTCSLICLQGYIINTAVQNQCKICQTSCLSCIQSQYLYKQICYTNSCPFGTEPIQNTNICQAKLAPSVKIITDPNNLQFQSDVIIQAQVTSQINIINQQWTLISPQKEASKIFQNVQTTFATLIIPVDNFNLSEEYIFQLVVENLKGSVKQTFQFHSSQLIQVGTYDINSDSSQFLSGSSLLTLNLQGWKSSQGLELKYDVFVYNKNQTQYTQNGQQYLVNSLTKVKAAGSGLTSNKQITFKTLPLVSDTQLTFQIRAYTTQKSVTVEKQILILANQNYQKMLIDQQKTVLNITSASYFGADDNFYLNFFGTNLPSETEDIVIQFEIAKQLLRNNSYVQDAQFHEKEMYFQMLQVYNATQIPCQDSIDCNGNGKCYSVSVPFSWTPLNSTNQTNQASSTIQLVESYHKIHHFCNCNPLFNGITCNWQSTFFQNITQKVNEATIYIQQLPQNLLNPASILNLFATMSEFKDVIVNNIQSILVSTTNFLKYVVDQPIYFQFVNEIIMNYIDILINYNPSMDQSVIKQYIINLFSIHQNYTQQTSQYLYEKQGMLTYTSNVYQLVLSEIDQKNLLSQSTSQRLLKKDAYRQEEELDFFSEKQQKELNKLNSQKIRYLQSDLFEFGDGTDILLQLYSIPSISVNANKIQVLIPIQTITNPGKIVIRVQNFLINPFDYMINCTLIQKYQVSQIAQVDIFNQNQLVPTIQMSAPITIVLKKLIRASPPTSLNITVSAYQCMNYMQMYNNWNSTNCSVQSENSTHIACSCYSLQGPVVVIASINNTATPVTQNSILLLNEFLNPGIESMRKNLLISLGLLNPNNNKTDQNNNTNISTPTNIYQFQNYYGIYSLCVYCFGISLLIFSFASSKTKNDDQNSNIKQIRYPYLHFYPLYSFFCGPTNVFVSNISRSFILLTVISSVMFYPSILIAIPNVKSKFSFIQISLISCAASVGTSCILFALPTFLKLGLNNLNVKKIKKKKWAFVGFSYTYLIQVLALLYIIVTQYFVLVIVGSYTNNNDISLWLQCAGFAYLFENVLDILIVFYVMAKGIQDKLSQLIALRGYVLLPEELLVDADASEQTDFNDDDIFEDQNKFQQQNIQAQDSQVYQDNSSSDGSQNSIEIDDMDEENRQQNQYNIQESQNVESKQDSEDEESEEEYDDEEEEENQEDEENDSKQKEGRSENVEVKLETDDQNNNNNILHTQEYELEDLKIEAFKNNDRS